MGKNNFASCYSGYESGVSPELDVHRLGALCGPSNGLQAAESVITTERTQEATQRTVSVQRGDCVRLVAATSSTSVEVEIDKGEQTLESCEISPFGWCPAEGPLCLPNTGPPKVKLTLTTRIADPPKPGNRAPLYVSSQLWSYPAPKRLRR